MTIEQYYMMMGAVTMAGVIFVGYALIQWGQVIWNCMKTLEGIEDYESA